MKAVVAGTGVVAARAARAILAAEPDASVMIVGREPARAASLAAALGGSAEAWQEGLGHGLPDAEVVVLAVPAGCAELASEALDHGAHVVSSADDPSEVRALLALDTRARAEGRVVVAGAAMAPGLACVLALQGARNLDVVEEVHVASMGTGGPACARRHHAALTSIAVDWLEGAWRHRPGGSGRELVWFPEPVGGADCYRAGLADPLLLLPAFPAARRITARLAATRRDRMTSWLPMLRPPHPEGLIGAVRVELRGRRGRQVDSVVLGAAVRPALAAGAVAATAARWASAGLLRRSGAGGLAELVPAPARFLKELASQGVTVSVFEGDRSATAG